MSKNRKEEAYLEDLQKQIHSILSQIDDLPFSPAAKEEIKRKIMSHAQTSFQTINCMTKRS